MTAAYAEIVHWRKNNFPIPFGNVGKSFVSELGRLYRAYAEGSSLEAIALKATTVMSILLLQKPFRTSKPKDHSACLKRRLNAWYKGDINSLVLEGRSLQQRLPYPSKNDNKEKDTLDRAFSRLMFQGKTNAALQLLSHKGRSSVLHVNDPTDANDPDSKHVLDILKSKHPHGKPATQEALMHKNVQPENAHPIIFDQITAASIRSASLRTKGSAGPSGIDAHCWRRMCTSFKSASHELCHSLALLAKRLCTALVDPRGLSPLLACRLIALDKRPGVRPIGICEIARRIIAKAILFIIKGDIQEAAGSQQLCAGQIAGIEAAVHSMRSIFSNDSTEAVLLVDASNAFNSLNRQAALLNIRHTCPPLATILINTYRDPSEQFVDGQTLWSEEGTTQGDPLAMPMYALATLPLINLLSQESQDTKHVWYADDATVSGSLESLLSWWEKLTSLGPAFGYHANARKTWLITKEQHLSKAEDLYRGTQVNITPTGRPHLGASLGSKDSTIQHVTAKVTSWCEELQQLAKVANTQPHAAYTAFTHGFVHKFTYLARTVPDIDHLQRPLEDIIRCRLIPALTGRAAPSDMERALLALPVRLGGLGLINLNNLSSMEFPGSTKISSPITDLIMLQQPGYSHETREAQTLAKREVQRVKLERSKSSAEALLSTLPNRLQRAMELAQEKGASSWLNTLPLDEFGFTLHKGSFRDALALRYGWQPSNTPTQCACGSHFTVEHSLSCPKGGFPTIRHNEIRDTIANLMTEVCNDVCIEPHLQPITGETFSGASATTEDGARLNIAANGFWGSRYGRAYFDVRVFNPYAPSNRQPTLAATYRKHEQCKIRTYEQRIREVEHSSFTPLVMSLTGGTGKATNVCLKRLASMLSEKWDQKYNTTISWLRCRLSFSLLRSSIQCIRGSRSARGHADKNNPPPMDLVTSEANLLS